MRALYLPGTIRMALACSTLVLLGASFTSAREVQVIAVSGDPVPGLAGHYFDAFQHHFDITVPSFNQAGEAAFVAQVRDEATGLTELGIFTSRGPNLEMIAKTGDQAPGAQDGFLFGGFGSSSLSENGKVAFSAVIDDGLFFNRRYGIWAKENGSVGPIVQSGVEAPGITPSRTLGDISSPKINSNGDLAFIGKLSPSSFGGLFTNTSGGLQKIAFPGDPAPGIRGEFNPFFGSDSFVVDEAGNTVFANTTGTGSVSYSIWKDYELLAAPGLGYDAPASLGGESRRLTSISRHPLINPSGAYTFRGRSEAFPPGPEDPADALFSGQDGSVREVVRSGQTLLGQPDVTFTELFAQSVNSEGHIAFSAWTTSNDIRTSVWSESGEELHLVVKWGDPVPGDPGREFRVFSHPQINASEQVAFYADIFTSETGYYRGIWAEDRSGELQLIAAQGLEVEVAPGVFKTIDSLVEPGRSGQNTPMYFSDRGQVLFRAVMADGTEGIFISNMIAVPEPATWALVLLGCSLALPWRCTPYHS